MSKKWIEGRIRKVGNKDTSQKALRKKIIKHCSSLSHDKASEIVSAKSDYSKIL